MPTTITIQAHHQAGEEQGQLTGSWCAILRSGKNIKPLKGTLHRTDPEKTLLTAITHALKAVLRRDSITLHVASSLQAEIAPELIEHGLSCTPLPARSPHGSDQELWETLLKAAEPHSITWENSASSLKDMREAEKLITESQKRIQSSAMPLIARPVERKGSAKAKEAPESVPTVFDDEISRVVASLPDGLHLRLEETQPGQITLSVWKGQMRIGYPTLLDNRPYEDLIVQNYRLDSGSIRQMIDLLGQKDAETATEESKAFPELPL